MSRNNTSALHQLARDTEQCLKTYGINADRCEVSTSSRDIEELIIEISFTATKGIEVIYQPGNRRCYWSEISYSTSRCGPQIDLDLPDPVSADVFAKALHLIACNYD